MLRNLTVKNYALIESLDLELGQGLTIITGETGAGKSIMIGALSLIMGGRADTKAISDGNSKSEVSAHFTDIDPALKDLFDARGVEWCLGEEGRPEMSVRREISVTGRSKVFINDTPVTLQTLSMITPSLIDIHSQHANARINDPGERLNIIDILAQNRSLIAGYQTLFDSYVSLRKEIRRLKNEREKSAANREYLQFQFDQLKKLNPKKGELKEIERSYEILSDADEIKERLQSLSAILGNSDRSIQSLLGEAVSMSEKIDFDSLLGRRYDSETPDSDESDDEPQSMQARLKSLLIELKDISETVEDVSREMTSDPARLARMSARMNLYYETMKRFRVADADELADRFAEISGQLAVADGGDGRLPGLETKAREVAAKLRVEAEKLSESRKKSASRFSELLMEKARPLGLPNINFKAEVSPVKLTRTGQDAVEFLCSFNKNGALRPLGEIASGGEISRTMLALKSIIAGHLKLPTIIFDEVDTGVSGEVADKMGRMMQEMGRDMQVIAITHLPQVAAKGEWHFKVYKDDNEIRTVSRVRQLGHEERVAELAAMISGSEVGEAALSAAKELLDQ